MVFVGRESARIAHQCEELVEKAVDEEVAVAQRKAKGAAEDGSLQFRPL
jgi:hypothetical protein